ncbi:hypothetical protein B296_00055627, partial [Ensete ventricosum]
QPPKVSTFLGTGGSTAHPRWSSGLLLIILQRAPNELPDPFSESPSELPARSHCIV